MKKSHGGLKRWPKFCWKFLLRLTACWFTMLYHKFRSNDELQQLLLLFKSTFPTALWEDKLCMSLLLMVGAHLNNDPLINRFLAKFTRYYKPIHRFQNKPQTKATTRHFTHLLYLLHT